jgi:membrane protein
MSRLRSWFDFARAVFTRFGEDQGPVYAASIAYYTLFSIFPLVLGLVAILGFFLESNETRARLVDFLSGYLPQAKDLISGNAETVRDSRGLAGLIAIGGFLWSAKAVFSAINAALNRAWQVKEQRPFWLRTLQELVMVLGVAVFFLLSIGITAILATAATFRLSILGLDQAAPAALEGVSFLLPIVFNVGIFAILYRLVPHTKVAWRDVWPAAIVAAVAFEIAKQAFVWYTVNFGNYSAVYGTLGTAIGLLSWAYISAVILIFGAEISAVSAGRRMHVAGGKGVTLVLPAA